MNNSSMERKPALENADLIKNIFKNPEYFKTLNFRTLLKNDNKKSNAVWQGEGKRDVENY